jgi:hypothetical protein
MKWKMQNKKIKFDPAHLSIYGHEFVSSLLIEKKRFIIIFLSK